MSLSAHITAGTAAHGQLAFHPNCPRCRAERLAGSLGADSVVSRRTQAALAAGLLAFSAGAPPALAQVPEVDEAQQETPAPGGEPSGLSPDLDPGGDDSFDYNTAPLPGGPEAGGEEDAGLGAPVETEPPTDVEAPPVAEEAPAHPPSEQSPTPAPTPTPAPASPPAATAPVPSPAAPPAQRPAVEPEQQAPQPVPREKSAKRKTPERAARPHEPQRRPAIGTGPPAPASTAPVVQPVASPAPTAPAAQPVPPTTMSVSQPSEPPAAAQISGRSYTVRAGDSLWSIARRLLGAEASSGRIAREVNRLWELNQDRIRTGNPSLIHVGTVLEL